MQQIRVGKITLGIVLTVLGVALLLDLHCGWACFGRVVDFWPLSIVFLGLELIVVSRLASGPARFSVPSLLALIVVLGLAWSCVAPGTVVYWGLTTAFPGQATYTVEIPVDLPFEESSAWLDIKAVGDVAVAGEHVSRVTGAAIVTVRARNIEEAKQAAQRVECFGNSVGNTLYLEARIQGGTPAFVTLAPTFRLVVPHSANLRLKTISGDTAVSEIDGEVKIGSVSAEVPQNPFVNWPGGLCF